MTVSDAANWCTIISVPLTLLAWLVSKGTAKTFWKRWGKWILIFAVAVTVVGFYRRGHEKFIAGWSLRYDGGDLDRISDAAHWPSRNSTKIRFKIVNVDESELPQVKLQLKESQPGRSKFMSEIFGDGAIIEVDAPSQEGDRFGVQEFYVSPVNLPGGSAEFFKRNPKATLQAYQILQ